MAVNAVRLRGFGRLVDCPPAAHLFAAVCALFLQVFVMPSATVNSMTLAAKPTTVPSNLRVLWCVLVTMWAVSLQSVNRFLLLPAHGSTVRSSAEAARAIAIVMVTGAVQHICAVCIPAKIVDMIVVRVIVPVAGFQAWWARSDECFHHQQVHSTVIPTPQHDEGHAVDGVSWFENLTGDLPGAISELDGAGKRAHSAMIRNFVQPFISDYGAPILGVCHSLILPESRRGKGAGTHGINC